MFTKVAFRPCANNLVNIARAGKAELNPTSSWVLTSNEVYHKVKNNPPAIEAFAQDYFSSLIITAKIIRGTHAGHGKCRCNLLSNRLVEDKLQFGVILHEKRCY